MSSVDTEISNVSRGCVRCNRRWVNCRCCEECGYSKCRCERIRLAEAKKKAAKKAAKLEAMKAAVEADRKRIRETTDWEVEARKLAKRDHES